MFQKIFHFGREKLQKGYNYHENISNLFLLTGSSILFLFFSIFALSAATFALGDSLSNKETIASLILLIPFILLLSRKIFSKSYFVWTFAAFLLIANIIQYSFFIANQFLDIEYDSQWYHQEMIIALKEGWNPYWHKLTPELNPDISSQEILNSYPKAQEIIEASIYRVSNRIELVKSFNLMAISMSFFFVAAAVLSFKRINLLSSLIFAVIFIINPINLIQYLTTYVDGTIYNFILVFIGLLYFYYIKQKDYLIALLIPCLSLMWNIKLTSIIYSGVFFTLYLIILFYSEKVKALLKSLKYFAISGLIALPILGFHPYVTNFLWYGNPIYSDGKSSEDYLFINTPESLYYTSSVKRFVESIFSRPAILRGEGKMHELKMPFTLKDEDMGTIISDNTVGGFGPIFSGIFVFSIAGMLIILISREKPDNKLKLFLILFTILLSSMFFPVSSYARFIAPLWLLPSIVTLYLIYHNNWFNRLFGVIIFVCIIWNSYEISSRYWKHNVNGTASIKTQLEAIKRDTAGKNLAVDFGLFRSNRIRFKEAGINFIEESEANCTREKRRALSDYIPESEIILCY